MTSETEQAGVQKYLLRGYKQFITALAPTDTVTFNFGPWVGPREAHYRMKGFAGRVERIVLGKYYYREEYPRLAIVGFPEHLDTNPHWHAVVRADGLLGPALRVHAKEIWEQLVPDGQIHLARPRKLSNIKRYFTKELTISGRIDEVFVYARDQWTPM